MKEQGASPALSDGGSLNRSHGDTLLKGPWYARGADDAITTHH